MTATTIYQMTLMYSTCHRLTTGYTYLRIIYKYWKIHKICLTLCCAGWYTMRVTKGKSVTKAHKHKQCV